MRDIVATGVVRIVDLLFVHKGESGEFAAARTKRLGIRSSTLPRVAPAHPGGSHRSTMGSAHADRSTGR